MSFPYEGQAVFEQLTLSDFKMCVATALQIFNNYHIKITNNIANMAIS